MTQPEPHDWRTSRRPPGPPSPWLGLAHARAFRRRPLAFIDALRPFGDLVYFRLGPVHAYVINHPALIHETLVHHAKHIRKVPRMSRVLAQVNGRGLIVTEGDVWRRQRRLVQPAVSPTQFDRYARDTVESTRRMVDAWQPGQSVDVSSAMTHLTLAIIARVLFSADVARDAAPLGDAVRVLSEALTKEFYRPFVRPLWLPTPGVRRKRRALRTLDDLIWGLIRARRASDADAGDLLSRLLRAVDVDGDGGRMTDRQARDEAVTLFTAGHDTTAAALAWIWACVAHDPEVEARLVEEVTRVLGPRPATFDDLSRLTYTGCVVRETLRLYPPTMALLPRETTDGMALAGYHVPRGSWLYLFPWLTHRDARFFPDPLRFDPDRFSAARLTDIPAHAWFPFGHGPHACIGRELALMEATLVVATVLQRVRLRRPAGAPLPEPDPLVSVRPRGALPMCVEPV